MRSPKVPSCWRLVSSAVVAVASLAPLDGCRRSGAIPARDAATVADTLRGIVAVTGSDPLSIVQLTTAAGRAWQLIGTATPELRAAAGLEVTVHGHVAAPDSATRPIARYEALRFSVRSADGLAALDGVLERDGSGFALRLSDDRRLALTAVPRTLRDQSGARIWWAGPVDRAPNAYGILRGR